MSGFVLAESSRVRYATGAMMYAAQGIPYGLLAIAIPAWLASEGASASDIGSYLAVIVLPWAFKLISGPPMDRFEFLAMGRRRPWVIGAQLGLTLSLLGLMLIEEPAEQIALLTLLGVLINVFAATQDVAVDGMSIDLTPVREQGRLNAFMSFGKAAGWSITAAVSGTLLVTIGMQGTAIVAAAVSALALLGIILVLENEGERTLPWSRGEAGSKPRPVSSFGDLFAGLNKVLWTRVSIVLMTIMFFEGLVGGYGNALMPMAAVNLFGYTTPQWSQLVASMGIVGAVVALGVGPLIDRFGTKRMLFFTAGLVALHAFMIAQTNHLWENTTYVRSMLSAWVMLQPVAMVCVIALAMAICSSTVSATQFAVYMSTANLGHSAGSKIYGTVAGQQTYVENYMLLGAFMLIVLFVLFFHRHEENEKRGEDDEAGDAGSRKSHYTAAYSGAEGGVYWSGAMRCPKCRSDMEQVDYRGTVVDRCENCSGIWFDVGELDALQGDAAAVAAIDTGDEQVGKHYNQNVTERCPRCSGVMETVRDSAQQDLTFEHCRDCGGSFFDAGEFRDLTEDALAIVAGRTKGGAAGEPGQS